MPLAVRASGPACVPVVPCQCHCPAGGPSPDTQAPSSFSLPWTGAERTSRACSGGSSVITGMTWALSSTTMPTRPWHHQRRSSALPDVNAAAAAGKLDEMTAAARVCAGIYCHSLEHSSSQPNLSNGAPCVLRRSAFVRQSQCVRQRACMRASEKRKTTSTASRRTVQPGRSAQRGYCSCAHA